MTMRIGECCELSETYQNVNQYLKPDYDLATSSKVYDSTIGDVTTTTNYGSNPELGLAQSTTVDPTGLGLTTNMTYETQGATGSFLRQTSKTLPGSQSSNPSFKYDHYAATATADNPCTTGTTEAYRQAGFMKLKTEASPGTTSGGGGSGAVPVVQSSSNANVSSGNLVLNKPTGTADGDLLVMTTNTDLNASENMTYTPPSGWTQVLANTRSSASNAGTNLQVWYKVASSEPASYTVTPDHSKLTGGSILRITGQAASSFIAAQNVTAVDTGAEASAPSVTTTSANNLVLRIAAWDQNKTVTAGPSGVTQSYYVDASGLDQWGGYHTQATAGATGVAQWDLSSASPYVGFTLAIAPATSGGGGGTPIPGRATETIYNDAGQVVATRLNSDNWTCTTYDTRGRVLTTNIPDNDGAGPQTARTVANNYSVSGNPFITSSADDKGTISTTTDLLGRTTSYTDVNGNTTTSSYDSAGHLTGRSGPLGSESFVYDTYDRLTEQKLDGTTYATVAYDSFSRIQDVTYNDAKQTSGGGGSGSAPVVQSSTSGTASSGALTLNKPTGTATGDLLVMTASADLDASENVTYTVPSGWTQVLANTRSDTSSAGNNLQVWYKVATSSEATNYAITPDHNNLIGGSITRITGQDTTGPIDVQSVTASATGEATAPSVTTTAANDTVLRIATWDQSKTLVTAPSGATNSYYVDVSGHDNWGGYQTQATAGVTGAAQWDLSGGAPYVGFSLAIKPQASGGGASGTPMKLTLGRDSLGKTNSQSFTLNNGTVQTSDTVTFSQSNQIVSGTELGQTKSFTYDKLGRLTAAVIGGNSYSYGYVAQTSTTCPQTSANLNACKNTNRTSQTINGTTNTYCYDEADRLIASNDPIVNNAQYDTHGNIASLGSSTVTTFAYDSSDHNIGITEGSKSATYERDVQGRIAKRVYTNGTTTTSKYGFTAGSDTPDFVTDTAGNITEKYLELTGGIILTIRPGQTGDAQKTYSLPNLHGDIFATANASGVQTATFQYDPFGQQVSSSLPNNTVTGNSYGWVGQHVKKTESELTLKPIQMGERVYIPTLARFTQADPVEGGTANNYVYPPDPVNDFDLSGQFGMKDFANVASIGSMIPGPIGMVSAGVAAAAYAKAGDRKQAETALPMSNFTLLTRRHVHRNGSGIDSRAIGRFDFKSEVTNRAVGTQ